MTLKRTPIRRESSKHAAARQAGERRPRKAIKPKKRKASEYVRIYGSRARVEWVKEQPCVACGMRGRIENHHIRADGIGRKADARFIVPLCQRCHRDLHGSGPMKFQAFWEINFHELAAQTEARWQAYTHQREA